MSQQEINECKSIIARKLASGEIRRSYSHPVRGELKNGGVLSQTDGARRKREYRARLRAQAKP